MKKITRYLGEIKDNKDIRNELENARENGTLADYLKKADVSLSDEELELISGGQRGGMGNDEAAEARRRENSKGEVVRTDSKGRAIQWNRGGRYTIMNVLTAITGCTRVSGPGIVKTVTMRPII